ncbi:MAG: hypothetical protein ABIG90_01000 [bacterium]
MKTKCLNNNSEDIGDVLKNARDCDWSTIAKSIAIVIVRLIALAGSMWVVRHF